MEEVESHMGDRFDKHLMKVWNRAWETKKPVTTVFNGMRIIMFFDD